MTTSASPAFAREPDASHTDSDGAGVKNKSPHSLKSPLLLHGKSHCEGLNLGPRIRSGNLYGRSSRRRDT